MDIINGSVVYYQGAFYFASNRDGEFWNCELINSKDREFKMILESELKLVNE